MTEPIPGIEIEFLSGPRVGERVNVTMPCTLGASHQCQLQIEDPNLQGVVGRLENIDGCILFVDLGSIHGSIHRRGDTLTPLGGRIQRAEIWNGDHLELGDAVSPWVIAVHIAENSVTSVIASRRIDDVDLLTRQVTQQANQLEIFFAHTSSQRPGQVLTEVFQSGAKLVFDLVRQATHITIANHVGAGRFPIALSVCRDGASFDGNISRTLMTKVVTEHKSLLLSNAANQLPTAFSVVQAGLASTMCVPLWSKNDIHGILQVDNRNAAGMFTGNDLEAVTVAAHQISLGADNARLVAELTRTQAVLTTQNQYLKKKDRPSQLVKMIGESTAMRDVTEAIERVRNTRVPVLIRGETGTGKELVARALHDTSNRSHALFVAQNCSALSDNLLESELFGHVKGAFTGAHRHKKGLFELADGGTIFLDELGEMPPTLQAKLLRVIQEGEIWPVGASGPRHVDVRIVSATHRSLESMVRENLFRQDLFFRLNVFPIDLPPLRQRRGDIPLLAEHFLAHYGAEFGCEVCGFSREAMATLQAYEWPGNIRELQNEIQRLLIRGPSSPVQVRNLSPHFLGEHLPEVNEMNAGDSLKEMMDCLERRLLAKALTTHCHHKTKTAAALGITREGLHKKLVRHGMQ
jgi:transcriptional regulator with GAF, ATPase, and Fis domain